MNKFLRVSPRCSSSHVWQRLWKPGGVHILVFLHKVVAQPHQHRGRTLHQTSINRPTPILYLLVLGTLLLLCASPSFGWPGRQRPLQQKTPPPISALLVIDNSCSMFAPEDIPYDLRQGVYAPCSNSGVGNDRRGLRFEGAELFAARLGYAEENTERYQLGIVSLGADDPAPEARIIRPLERLNDEQRNEIANLLTTTRPEVATEIGVALDVAYQEMRRSHTDNLKAIILITDGAPVDSNTGAFSEAIWQDVDRLLRANQDVPIFVLFLQDQNNNLQQTYREYRQRWSGLANELASLSVRDIGDTDELVAAYNTIIAELQNTIPRPVVTVQPGVAQSFEVSEFTQQVVITSYRGPDPQEVTITITDPDNNPVQPGQPGVDFWQGEDNSFQVFSIKAERLMQVNQPGAWQIEADGGALDILIDERGAYAIRPLEPEVDLVRTNVYEVRDQQPLSRSLTLRVDLFDPTKGEPIAADRQQPVSLRVIPPGMPPGEEPELVTENVLPASDGTYTFNYNPGAQAGQFRFIVAAGQGLIVGNDPANAPNPIARAEIIVNAADAPYVAAILPDPLVCEAAAPLGTMEVSISSWEQFRPPESLHVRAFLSDQDGTELTAAGRGVFTTSLETLCGPLLATLPCGQQQQTSIRILFNGTLPSDPAFQRSLERSVELRAASCQAPPPHTPNAPNPEPPPPPPDPGQDSFPVPWLPVALTVLAVAAVALWYFFIGNFHAPGLEGYIQVNRPSTPGNNKVYSLKRYKKQVTIGSGRRAHIRIETLKSEEFVVETHKTSQGGQQTRLKHGGLYIDFTDQPQLVLTSDTDIYLCIGLNQDNLRC